MNAYDINQSYDLLALAQGDTKLKRSGAYYIGACPFCGGRDRFNLKDTSQGWRWYCRKCGDGKYHTSIDYVMRRENLNFKQALESLGSDTLRPRVMVTPEEPALVIPDQAWQLQRWHEVNQANDTLVFSPHAKHARKYLLDRCLTLGTWQVNLLGFDYVYKRPAIVIPWYDDANSITAIKYRFIDGDPDKRFMMAAGSKPILFGLQAATGRDVLIFVEGEINAMSITQISTEELLHIDALSFGSETGSRKDVIRMVAQDYQRVIVWADDPEKAKTIRSSLTRPADALCSPKINGVKYDANALLQKAWLADFLQETINQSQTVQKMRSRASVRL